MYVRGAVEPVSRHGGGELVEATADAPAGAEFPPGVPWAPGQRRALSLRVSLPPWLRPVPTLPEPAAR